MSDYSGLLSQLAGENTGFVPSEVLDEKINEGKEYAKQLVEGAGSILTTKATEGALKALYKNSKVLQNVGLSEGEIGGFVNAVKTGDPATILEAFTQAGKSITRTQANKIIQKVQDQINTVKPDLQPNPASNQDPEPLADVDPIDLGAKSMQQLTGGDENLARLTNAFQRVSGGKKPYRGLAEPDFDDAAEQVARYNFLDPSKLGVVPISKPVNVILQEAGPFPKTPEELDFLSNSQSAESKRLQIQRAEQFQARRQARLEAQRAKPKPSESNAGQAARQEASNRNEASVPEEVRIPASEQTGGRAPRPEDVYRRPGTQLQVKADDRPIVQIADDPDDTEEEDEPDVPQPPQPPIEEFSDQEQLARIIEKGKNLNQKTMENIRDRVLADEDDKTLLNKPIQQVPKRIANKFENLTEKVAQRKAELDAEQQAKPEPEEEFEGFGEDEPETEPEEEEEEEEEPEPKEIDPEDSAIDNITKASEDVEDTAKTGIKAFEDVTKGIAEDPVDDFDPLSIGLQAVAGLGALAAGAFIKSRKPKFVKPPDITPPTSIGVELGGGLD